MSQPTVLERRILENHLAFTALHRARVIREASLIRWDSPSDAFSCVLLQSPDAVFPNEVRNVRTFPWTDISAQRLAGQNFERHGCLRYMVLQPGREHPARPPANFDVTVVSNVAELLRFSEVQSRGFVSPGEPLAPLRAFLHEANLKNLHHPDQVFYVGFSDGVPVAVTLLLAHQGTAGIYAVATLPEFRGRGFSRALLGRAIADGQRMGCGTVTLQVYRDSDAERLYRHLGFEVAFDCSLWRRVERNSSAAQGASR